MKRFLILLFLTYSLQPAAFGLTDAWSVNVNDHAAVQRTYKRGESIDMRITLREGLKPIDLTGATARWFWYTNAVDNLWWTNAAAITTPRAGLVAAQWTPTMDVGASLYAYWVGIWMPGATSPLWRVTGTIRLLPSPGFTPNALTPPVRTLDFASIAITNAPWVTAADWAGGSNALASALSNVNAVASGAAAQAESNRVALASLPPPSTDALRLMSTNAVEWIDGSGGRWRIEQRATTNENQLLMYESGFNEVVVLTKIPVSGVNQWSGMGVFGYTFAFGDVFETGEYYADAWYEEYETADWRICNPSGLDGWPKTYGNELENTGGWVDLIVDYETVTSRVDTVVFASALSGLSSAWTNSLLYASNGTNYYPRWDSALQTYVVMGVPQ